MYNFNPFPPPAIIDLSHNFEEISDVGCLVWETANEPERKVDHTPSVNRVHISWNIDFYNFDFPLYQQIFQMGNELFLLIWPNIAVQLQLLSTEVSSSTIHICHVSLLQHRISAENVHAHPPF